MPKYPTTILLKKIAHPKHTFMIPQKAGSAAEKHFFEQTFLRTFVETGTKRGVERAAGIEPASSAWKAEVIASIRRPLSILGHIVSLCWGQVAFSNLNAGGS